MNEAMTEGPLSSNKMFEMIEGLKLPKDKFVVVGSGILAALEIRRVSDIDILVDPTLFARLCKDIEWTYIQTEINDAVRESLKCGQVEIFKEFCWNGDVMTFKEGLLEVEVIQGISFVSLPKLLEIKAGMNREKDKADIDLIASHMEQHERG